MPTTTADAFTLQADPDIAGAFVVVANDDGEILGFGDTEAEALAGARVAAAARHEAAAFRRFAAAVEGAIGRVQTHDSLIVSVSVDTF